MRSKSKNPGKQRLSQFRISKGEVHKVMSANLSRDLRERRGFRSLPIREGDTVTIVRGKMKSRSGKVIRVDPKKQRIFVDKVVKRKTDNTEIAVPIHPSNVVITKYHEKDRRRLEVINRRIKSVEEKIDIDAVLAEAEEEAAEDVIEFDDTDLELEEKDLELVEPDELQSDENDAVNDEKDQPASDEVDTEENEE